MASDTSDLRLPSQPKLVLISHTHGDGQDELNWVAAGWLHTETVYAPEYIRSPIQALTMTIRAQRTERRVTRLI